MANTTYLKRAQLSGYKSVQHADIDFHPGLNIIIGYNGVGKTNFMEMLNGLSPFSNMSEKDYIINKLDANFKALLDYQSIDRSNEFALFECNFKSYPKQEKPAIPPNSKNLPKTTEKIYLQHTMDWYDFDNIPDHFFHYYLSVECVFIKHGIASPIHFFNTPDEIIIKIAPNFDDEIKTKTAQLHEKASLFYNSIAELNIVDGIRFAEEQMLKELRLDQITLRNLRVLYKLGDNEYFFEELSDGIKRIIYILSQIFIAIKTRTWFPFLFLIEEPELGIHPHLLHQLLVKLRSVSEDSQVIMTTHSPQVLDILEIDELDRIIIADYDPQKGTVLRHLTDEQMEQASIFMENTGSLSSYWLHTNLMQNPDYSVA